MGSSGERHIMRESELVLWDGCSLTGIRQLKLFQEPISLGQMLGADKRACSQEAPVNYLSVFSHERDSGTALAQRDREALAVVVTCHTNIKDATNLVE